MTSLTDLKRLAEAATAGPWTNRELENMEDCILGSDGETWVLYNDEINTMKQTDSDYVTAANPQQIIAMIECMEKMQTALRYIADYYDPVGFSSRLAHQTIAAYDQFAAPQGDSSISSSQSTPACAAPD